MIKKPTLIVLVCAAILAGTYYFINWRATKADKSAVDAFKPAFTLQASDVSSITISHPSKPDQAEIRAPLRIERIDGRWQIVQPIQTTADSSAVEQSLDNVTAARITQTEPYTPDRMKAFGLDPPQLSLGLQLKNGTKHTLLIGDKIFDGASIYTVIDNAKSVSVLPDSVLTSSDKTLDDFRDRTVLPIKSSQVASFTLKNGSTELAVARNKDGWVFAKPINTRADQESISAFLNAVENARFATVASEKADNLARYGLNSPAISFAATDDTGKIRTLIVGKKDGNDYFARDTARPTVFRISGDLDTQLTKTFADLRDKKVLHFDAGDMTRIEIHNDHGTIIAINKGSDSWALESPDPQKGKNTSSSKLFDALEGLSADKITDHASGAITAKLAKPGIEVTLADKNKKTISLKVSRPVGEVVYAQAGDSPAVYYLKKQDFETLNFEPVTLVQ